MAVFFFLLKVAALLVLSGHFTAAYNVKHKLHAGGGDGVQPLSKIQIHRAVAQLHENASVSVYPVLLGTKVFTYFQPIISLVSGIYFHIIIGIRPAIGSKIMNFSWNRIRNWKIKNGSVFTHFFLKPFGSGFEKFRFDFTVFTVLKDY